MLQSVRIGGYVLAAATVVAMPGLLQAANRFSALERTALQVKAPELQVLQAAAQAGSRIVAVGERGIIVLSDDGGKSWRQARQVPVSTTLTALSFANEKTGWAVGHGGVVLHTQDGGESWRKQADGKMLADWALKAAQTAQARNPEHTTAVRALSDAQLLVNDGPDKPLLDVYFQDAQHGWIIGAYNLFFETTDGGATWNSISQRIDNPKGLHLYAVRAQGTLVFVVGEQGQMHRSRDGGHTFETVTSPYKGSWFALALSPEGAVVAAGLRGNAFYSADFGNQWQEIAGAAPTSFVSAARLPSGEVLLANQAGQLFTTQDGAPLQALSTPPLPPLTGVLLLKEQRLLALGLGGVVPLPLPGQNGTAK
ncbi:MAG: YCF48-related protein [Giesbergeria sp.]|uniref:WD40/YVTN/BNR-like repeat-containing protein n=1 Tax=Giesbergeria sp. TaxID=2818473 RepID=UPI00261F5200|nr:YCF48-related protein [Giesbergeria sp.]MDD2610225.1 YCF48-related protein [Giesbergeria sp.]